MAASGGVEGCLAMTRLLLLCALMGREGNHSGTIASTIAVEGTIACRGLAIKGQSR